MSFDELLKTPQAPELEKLHAQLPEAWKPGMERKADGSAVVVTPGFSLSESTEDAVAAYLEEHGFPREHYMLKPGTGILSKQWTALRKTWNTELEAHETIVQDMQSSRVEVVPRRRAVDIEELVAIAGAQDPVNRDPADYYPGAFGLALGDLQLGKIDGDGPEGTIRRFKQYVTKAVEEYQQTALAEAHLAFLGDCIEGFVSQGGRNAWRTCLTTTEQVRILRRLMLWAIDQFVDAGAYHLTVVSVPGNHDEAMRMPVSTRSDDSWAIDALVAVSDAMELNPERYGHVECFVPGPDEQDVTLEVAGFPITHNHGHLYLSGKDKVTSAYNWWEGQAFSHQPAGQAKLMLAAHGHHFQVAERSGRTWCMVPALEELSTWWVHKTGQTGDPGVVVFTIEDGQLMNLSRRRLPKGEA